MINVKVFVRLLEGDKIKDSAKEQQSFKENIDKENAQHVKKVQEEELSHYHNSIDDQEIESEIEIKHKPQVKVIRTRKALKNESPQKESDDDKDAGLSSAPAKVFPNAKARINNDNLSLNVLNDKANELTSNLSETFPQLGNTIINELNQLKAKQKEHESAINELKSRAVKEQNNQPMSFSKEAEDMCFDIFREYKQYLNPKRSMINNKLIIDVEVEENFELKNGFAVTKEKFEGMMEAFRMMKHGLHSTRHLSEPTEEQEKLKALYNAWLIMTDDSEAEYSS